MTIKKIYIKSKKNDMYELNDKKRYISIDDLFSDYRKTVLNPDDILCSIILPIPPSDKSFYAWKVSKRHDQDISTVSIASLIGVNDNNIIQSCKICFGGLSATTLRTKEVENTLLGKNPITAQKDAIDTLKRLLNPFLILEEALLTELIWLLDY